MALRSVPWHEVIPTVILKAGYGVAQLAGFATILLSTAHLFEVAGLWAAVIALVLWPFTLLVGPVVAAMNGYWIVPATFGLALVSAPVAAMLSWFLTGALRDRDWVAVLVVAPLAALLLFLLPGLVVQYQLDRRLTNWPPWSTVRIGRAR